MDLKRRRQRSQKKWEQKRIAWWTHYFRVVDENRDRLMLMLGWQLDVETPEEKEALDRIPVLSANPTQKPTLSEVK